MTSAATTLLPLLAALANSAGALHIAGPHPEVSDPSEATAPLECEAQESAPSWKAEFTRDNLVLELECHLPGGVRGDSAVKFLGGHGLEPVPARFALLNP
jgi:hypothetical protein